MTNSRLILVQQRLKEAGWIDVICWSLIQKTVILRLEKLAFVHVVYGFVSTISFRSTEEAIYNMSESAIAELVFVLYFALFENWFEAAFAEELQLLILLLGIRLFDLSQLQITLVHIISIQTEFTLRKVKLKVFIIIVGINPIQEA